jgi:hypothetical protein
MIDSKPLFVNAIRLVGFLAALVGVAGLIVIAINYEDAFAASLLKTTLIFALACTASIIGGIVQSLNAKRLVSKIVDIRSMIIKE